MVAVCLIMWLLKLGTASVWAEPWVWWWGGGGQLLTVCEFIFLIFQALAQISLFFLI